jgi:Taurine catabolism dioxygenase TauD, TfdA family
MLVTPADPSFAGPEALASWAAQNPQLVTSWTSSTGAALFRGFRVTSPRGFQSVAASLLPNLPAYVGGDAPRRAVMDRIYDATSPPPSEDLLLHNELSYSGWWPTLLLFCCVSPVSQGGQTKIADGRQVYTLLPEDVRHPFSRLGVTYHQHLRDQANVDADGQSWQGTFQKPPARRSRTTVALMEYCGAGPSSD